MASKNSESSEPVSPPSDLLLECDAGLADVVREIRAGIEVTSAQLKEKYNSSKASHLAFLGDKLADITREVRQREKHEEDRAKAMTTAEEFQGCLEYVRELPLERRVELKAFLVELETSASLLGHDVKPVS